MRLRVLTMNVQNDEGDPRRAGLLNAELRRLDPDLVALQEVCYPDRRDHLSELTTGTGLRHTTHQAGVLERRLPEADRYGGTAVATRWPHRVVEVAEHRPDRPADVHWWTLAVTVDLPDAGELLLITPTTPWQPGAGTARERQAAGIIDLAARHGTALPTIIAGDLNADPRAASVRRLTAHYRDAWAVAGEGPGHTWFEGGPRRIDYVFAGPGAAILSARLVADRPVDGVRLSDHAGVLADLHLAA
jgi:endonuclease/exonuclease/phosphatase family metal-dependent hydrolase